MNAMLASDLPLPRIGRGKVRDIYDLGDSLLIVATDRVKLNNEGKSYKDPQTGYTAKETEFHKVTLFNGLGKAVAENKEKGDMIAIEGRLHYTRWQDQGGVERFGCEVIGEKVHFC